MSVSENGGPEISSPEISDPDRGGLEIGNLGAQPAPPFPIDIPDLKRPQLSWRSWLPSLTHLLILAVILLTVSNLGLWIGLQKARRGPQVAVVGVREMTQRYLAKVSTAQMSPQELAMRTSLFVGVAQEEIRRLSPVSGQLVLARECVLSGEATDITPALERIVETRLGAAFGDLSNTAAPIAGVTSMRPAAPISPMVSAP